MFGITDSQNGNGEKRLKNAQKHKRSAMLIQIFSSSKSLTIHRFPTENRYKITHLGFRTIIELLTSGFYSISTKHVSVTFAFGFMPTSGVCTANCTKLGEAANFQKVILQIAGHGSRTV
jgi:hypothetical protein